MKRRVVSLLLCVAMVFGLTACGGSSNGTVENTESTEAKMPVVDLAKYELNYADYVTLCDYNAIPVTLSSDYVVTDEMVEDYIVNWFNHAGPFYTPDKTKKVVAEGDIVCADYVGKLDGEAFAGGSAENQLLDVSGNCSADANASPYIEGFTAGLLGAKVGTEVDCDVTFPEDYHNTDLAGKAVVFTFTVKSIEKKIEKIEDIDDSFAKRYAGTETLDEMYEYVREMFEVDAANYKMQEIDTGIQQYLLENCIVEIPFDYFSDLLKAYRNMYIWQNCGGDEAAFEVYVQTSYNMTSEEVEEEWRKMLLDETKLEFIVGAIAEEMGLELSQEDYEERLASLMNYYQISTKEEVFESYGYGDVVFGEESLKKLYLQDDALGKIAENVVITIAEPAEENTENTENTEIIESTEN